MRKLADGRGLAKVPALTRQIADGELDVADWDDEELLRGRRRDKNGGWTGPRAPKLVPIQLHQELTRRRMQQAHAALANSVVDAVRLLREVVNDNQAARRTRVRAAEILIHQALGRPRESVDLNLSAEDEAPWKALMNEAIVGIVGSADQIKELEARKDEEEEDPDIIEGEIVEDEPRPDPKRKRKPSTKRGQR